MSFSCVPFTPILSVHHHNSVARNQQLPLTKGDTRNKSDDEKTSDNGNASPNSNTRPPPQLNDNEKKKVEDNNAAVAGVPKTNNTTAAGEEGATMRRKKTKKGGGIDPRVTRNITEEEVLKRITGQLRSMMSLSVTSCSGHRTVWGGRLRKRFCSTFSGSSPCLLGQHGSCSSAQLPVELSENMLQNVFLNLPHHSVHESQATLQNVDHIGYKNTFVMDTFIILTSFPQPRPVLQRAS